MIEPSITEEQREQLHASLIRIGEHFRAFAEALNVAAKALTKFQQDLQSASQDDYALAPPHPKPKPSRPAWQSPYGPPRKGHR